VSVGLEQIFALNRNVKNPLHPKNLTLGDESPKVMWASFG
jgi:hypothetical protein